MYKAQWIKEGQHSGCSVYAYSSQVFGCFWNNPNQTKDFPFQKALLGFHKDLPSYFQGREGAGRKRSKWTRKLRINWIRSSITSSRSRMKWQPRYRKCSRNIRWGELLPNSHVEVSYSKESLPRQLLRSSLWDISTNVVRRWDRKNSS